MTFKNSMKILSSNFSLCWKQLAWIIICTIITFGIAALAAMPVFSMLKNEGFFAAVTDFFELFYISPKEIPTAFAELVNLFVKLISAHAKSGLLASYIGIVLVFVIFGSLRKCIGMYTCCSVLDAKMGSNAQMGYCSRLVSCLGKSVVYSFAYVVLSLPFWATTIVFVKAYAAFAKGAILTIVLVPVLVLVLYLLYALKLTLFANTIPEMIVANTHNAFAAFGRGIKRSIGRFWRTFSNSICLLLVASVVNLFVGVFTLTAGLLVTIPATSVLIAAFNMVSHYQCVGRSFYVSEAVVVNLK